jgi:hypothetical protein
MYTVQKSFLSLCACTVLSLLLLGFFPVATAPALEQPQTAPRIEAFAPGETLTYDVSWSDRVKAGSATMEVRGERLADGRDVLRFIVTSHTVGALGRLYPIGDMVQSVFDPVSMQSLSYTSLETHGQKTRRKSLDFNHDKRKVTIALNEDPLRTYDIPDRVQDNLSSLYYLRTQKDFVAGTPITFDSFDSERTAVEIQILGREQVKTPAGEFSTIKVKAFKGLFMSEGEIFVWLTDDSRKIPVMMKSTLKFGTLVFTLADLKTGK